MTSFRCYTLFDILATGISNRKPPVGLDGLDLINWQQNRNRQVNFDTILQVISLRSQPENMTEVSKNKINFADFSNFGFLFDKEEDQYCYSFDFDINYKGAFDDGTISLGLLYQDCDGVPMIKIGSEWEKLPNFLDVTPELRNIYFEVLNDE